MDSTAASGSEPLYQTIQILSPGMQLETASSGTRVQSETEERVGSNRTLIARSSGGRKRRRQSSVKNGDHPRNSVKKVKEDDDTCAHPHPLQDYLSHGLDGVFYCQLWLAPKPSSDDFSSGVLWHQVGAHCLQRQCQVLRDCSLRYSPGRMSAETGHHYANPTNHFWRCLHRSGA